MNGKASSSLICIFVLVVLPCLTLALGGGRFVDWNDEKAEETARNKRQFLGRNRGVRAMDMLDAPSFGDSRSFGGFGYTSEDSEKRAHENAEY